MDRDVPPGNRHRLTTRGRTGLLVHGAAVLALVPAYLLIAPDGKVLHVDKMHWSEDGSFDIRLPDSLPPGNYTVIVGVFLDGNALHPSARIVRVRVGAGRPG